MQARKSNFIYAHGCPNINSVGRAFNFRKEGGRLAAQISAMHGARKWLETVFKQSSELLVALETVLRWLETVLSCLLYTSPSPRDS